MRARVLSAVLAAAAVGMLVAGGASYLVQREQVDRQIDDNLLQEVEELRELAGSGVDPETGQPFVSVDRFMKLALQRNVPSPSEGMVAIIDGTPAWYPGADEDLDLEGAPDFVRDVAAATPPDAEVRIQTADTALGSLRYVAVPVSVDGDPAEGVYLIAFSRDMEQAAVSDSYRTYAVVALAAVLVIGGAGWFVTSRLLRPIRLLRTTARQITDTDLTGRIPVTGNDEISDLARTFNGMLDRLEGAFAAQREALDDAGHELRTPITIVRGHLELMSSEDPAEVDEARTIALDELDRMQRLVDDLVLLAKAKRPDFVHLRPVELDLLVDNVLDKLRALGDRNWHVDARAADIAMLDEQRITQALLQLAANAVANTEVDDTIAIGSQVSGEMVQLWVRDTGSGIAADQLNRIFERFARGQDPGHREGSGLGLAIVRAIAESHHGQVSVGSTPGHGAQFTMSIPRGALG